MQYDIKLLSPPDIDRFIELLHLFEEVFDLEKAPLPPKKHLLRVMESPGFFSMVAISDLKVIGGLTAYTFEQYHSTQPIAYIYDLAVLTSYQQKGVGKSLIKIFNDHCKSLGYQEVFVQADKDEPEAVEFYRRTPITEEEDVAHFYYRL